MKHSSKRSIVIWATIIALILVVAWSTYYKFAPGNSEVSTIGGNTISGYVLCKEDTYFKYQFQYPENWIITFVSSGAGAAYQSPVHQPSCEGADSGLSVGPESDLDKNGDEAAGFSIEPYALSSTIYKDTVKNIDDYVSVVLPNQDSGLTVVNRTMIAGEQAIVLTDGSIVIIHKGSVYDMWFGGKTASTTKDLILKSFTFLK
jgi:hypothetical protein